MGSTKRVTANGRLPLGCAHEGGRGEAGSLGPVGCDSGELHPGRCRWFPFVVPNAIRLLRSARPFGWRRVRVPAPDAVARRQPRCRSHPGRGENSDRIPHFMFRTRAAPRLQRRVVSRHRLEHGRTGRRSRTSCSAVIRSRSRQTCGYRSAALARYDANRVLRVEAGPQLRPLLVGDQTRGDVVPFAVHDDLGFGKRQKVRAPGRMMRLSPVAAREPRSPRHGGRKRGLLPGWPVRRPMVSQPLVWRSGRPRSRYGRSRRVARGDLTPGLPQIRA
jgi:hypothetical protein